jgi:predicted polyphosphate/ATP-dependent NAD kinase
MKIGFVINPLAGIGGAVALKGSDGEKIVEKALSHGAQPRAEARASVAMSQIKPGGESDISILTAAQAMGENVLTDLKLPCDVIYTTDSTKNLRSSAVDTKKVIALFIEHGVDLIVFVGGDGTARDVLDAVTVVEGESKNIPVIGIPAGVKIHSAVYALTPTRAGELISLIVKNQPMSLVDAQVMDLDEQAFREGKVIAKCYGYLSVPVDDTRMQLIKQGGLNHHELAVQDIATDVIESMEQDVYYLIGSGSTTAEIMDQLNLENTLLGVDIVYNQTLVANDVDEKTILETINNHPVKIIVTIIGGQGHIFGRGNQQLSVKVINAMLQQSDDEKENIIIVATNEKLLSLENRPMIIDTGDVLLDEKLSGLYSVITGYQQKTLYRLN